MRKTACMGEEREVGRRRWGGGEMGRGVGGEAGRWGGGRLKGGGGVMHVKVPLQQRGVDSL